MQQFSVIMCIAVVIMAVNGQLQDLRVDVVPMQTRFAAVQNVKVTLKYSNVGSETMTIYKWALPETGLFDPLFEVTRNGEPVAYVGPIAKRRAPTADDLFYLTPGMTMSAVIELSSVYDMTETGSYMIQYKMNANQVLFTENAELKYKMMSSNDGQGSLLQSAPIVVFAIGRPNLLIEQANLINAQARALTPSYFSCTTAQTNSIRTAVNTAESYANSAVQYLNGVASGTSRYTTWFGGFTTAGLSKLKSHFSKIQSALSTKQLSFDCACPAGSSNTYAYVYSNQPYRVYLCGSFWPSPMTGTDSMGGTIIHELAHFTVLAGTSDYGYGQSTCQSLARSNPAQALMNSDSLQYFVENNPRLN
jgi:peptidyl-Lys metalloendopeptidase